MKRAKRMQTKVTVALVGDYDDSVPAHLAIPHALKRAADTMQIEVDFEWIPTVEIASVSRIASFDGIWCVPASPYQNMEGALLAIRHARESATPFLGTCGGFQHAIIEYARNVLGWADAEHAETAPGAARAVISPLECALVETMDLVRLFPGTHIAAAYGVSEIAEGYRCPYGLNPEFRTSLVSGPLRVAGDDAAGDVRVIEMVQHPFFVATLFQPERAALREQPAPIVNAFVSACAA
ncbi:CTP synthase C-terminal region-related (seleno)protein [Burkholderia sp. PAMC 28687]|uniref:CTP synthase C-terminal region-related (seleno)protein n=1 Tax=Burkholderia sp. PAMC 28687 TaxID=1795874 RepID=UPI0018D362E5|nr:CTP synthase [Burkholderia sp. PAMC 28687]